MIQEGPVKDLLLSLANRAVKHPEYKGGVSFLPGDARIIKRKIVRINDLLSAPLDVPIWEGVIVRSDKEELVRLIEQLTPGQLERLDETFCIAGVMTDSSVFDALRVVREVVKANKQAEEKIV